MNWTVEKETLTIALSGHIDSGNAPAVEAEIMDIRGNQPHSALVLDLKDLVYISSAGLRVVLRLRKLEEDFKLVNVSAEVYEILDMTGFTEMMTVEKARRSLSAGAGPQGVCSGHSHRDSLRCGAGGRELRLGV